MYYWIGLPTTILAAITSAFALSRFHVVAGSLALMVSALTALATFLNPNEKANSHYNSSNSYRTLADSIKIFYKVDSVLETSDSSLVNKLKEFDLERSEISLNSPIIPKWAHKKALRSGGNNGDLYKYVRSTSKNPALSSYRPMLEVFSKNEKDYTDL